MNTIFLGIVIFLCVLAVFDLVVGVSNDAVNFLNSAIGAKVAKFRTIVAVGAVGVFAGAAMSNGMMDVARHGIMTPEYFSFYEMMCVFLAVMVTDVILLDIFNTLGMPTSTTVSMVFELLGGAFAVAILKLMHGDALSADGELLTLGDLINTEKAISVIMGIFLSVAIAFVVGIVVMWVSRMVFTFSFSSNPCRRRRGLVPFVKQTLFGGVCITSIVWFLLINGLKGSSLMTPDMKLWIGENTWMVLGVVFGAAFLICTLMYLLPRFSREGVRGEGLLVLKMVVLLGTFALAMAFAGNDLVNFVGVPLTGLEAYQDYVANGSGDPDTFLMRSLMDSAHTPPIFLLLAGVVMVLSLIFSKKAQNVVKTSVDLSRQNEGDEMFGSSAAARTLVRQGSALTRFTQRIIPDNILRWIDTRFNRDEAVSLTDGGKEAPAFDLIRAAVNLVVAGLLVAIGTSLKLPLSTTYVTFMVAMGTSLADRAWGRESAVFRITGVLSVIGGWFITAGAAFIFCFILTNSMYFGSYVVMALAIILAIYLLVRSNLMKTDTKTKAEDSLFSQILKSKDKSIIWSLLCEHIRRGNAARLRFVIETYDSMTQAFLREQYQPLRRSTSTIEEERKTLKRQRKQEIVTMQRLDPIQMVSRNTWYFLGINSCQQMLYCLKRINEPLREHVGNSFSPLPESYHERFIGTKASVLNLYHQALNMLDTGDFTNVEALREKCTQAQQQISDDRKRALDSMQDESVNLNTLLLTVHLLQESQELLSCLRHMLRGMNKFAGAED